jgi:hypothetical protein
VRPRGWALVAVFFALSMVKVLRHEMWGDEIQAWRIVHESHGLGELWANTRYEGTPILWHLLLYAAHAVSGSMTAMKVVHVIVATAGVALVVRRAPFTFVQKALLAFGYFPFFEYDTISRSYVLGVFFTFLFCLVFCERPRRLWRVALVLALLCQTTVYGVMLAGAGAVAVAVDEARRPPKLGPALGAFGIFAMGVALALVQAIPPADVGAAPGMPFSVTWALEQGTPRAVVASTVVTRALLPLPSNVDHFWSSNVLEDVSPVVSAGVAAVLVLLAVLFLKKRPAAAAFFVVATAGVVGFAEWKYFGYLRHHGTIFIALVAAMWIRRARGTRVFRAGVTALLGVHLGVGLFAGAVDLARPMSETRHAADFIARSGLRAMPMLGDYDLTASEVGAYLDRPMYYPASGTVGTFPRWTSARHRYVSIERLLEGAFALAASTDALLVLDYRLPVASPRIRLLASFEGGTVRDSDVYLYVVSPAPEVEP